MKKQFLIFSLALSSLLPITGAWSVQDEGLLIEKLRSSAQSISVRGTQFFRNPEQHRESFELLRGAVKLLLNENDPELMQATVIYAGELAAIDNSATAGAILLPLWQKSLRDIVPHLNHLEFSKVKELKRQIEVRAREAREGNG